MASRDAFLQSHSGTSSSYTATEARDRAAHIHALRDAQFDQAMTPFIKDVQERGEIGFTAAKLDSPSWSERFGELVTRVRNTAGRMADYAGERLRGWLRREETENWQKRMERERAERKGPER